MYCRLRFSLSRTQDRFLRQVDQCRCLRRRLETRRPLARQFCTRLRRSTEVRPSRPLPRRQSLRRLSLRLLLRLEDKLPRGHRLQAQDPPDRSFLRLLAHRACFLRLRRSRPCKLADLLLTLGSRPRRQLLPPLHRPSAWYLARRHPCDPQSLRDLPRAIKTGRSLTTFNSASSRRRLHTSTPTPRSQYRIKRQRLSLPTFPQTILSLPISSVPLPALPSLLQRRRISRRILQGGNRGQTRPRRRVPIIDLRLEVLRTSINHPRLRTRPHRLSTTNRTSGNSRRETKSRSSRTDTLL